MSPVKKSSHKMVSIHHFSFLGFIRNSLEFSVFEEMDGNKDGYISQDEFVEACLSHHKFSTVLSLGIIDVFVSE